MSSAYDVGSVDDLADGQHLVVKVRGREIGVFNIRGNYYALPNVCFHQNGPLCRGAVSGTVTTSVETGWKRIWANDGEIVVCPWHSLEFNVITGQCLAYPQRRLPIYEVRLEGNRIKVIL